MRKQDIKTGVVYAYQRSSYYSPEPVVFLIAPSEGKLYSERDRFSRTGPAFRKARAGSKPERGNLYGSTGYAIAKFGYGAPSREPALLAGVTLADFEEATSVGGRVDGIQFDVITTLSQITGTYAEAVAAHHAKKNAEHAQFEREREQRDDRRLRASAAMSVLTENDIYATYVDDMVRLSVENAEKLAALLTSVFGPES